MPIIPLLNEKDLLSALKAGNEDAFEQLYHHYDAPIYQRLLRFAKDKEVAKELLQDVFMRVWEKRGNIDPGKSFKSYIFQIAQNLIIDLFRRAAYDRDLLDHLIQGSLELYTPVDDHSSYNEISAVLQQAIDLLPPQRRNIYQLCKIEGRSYAEVSKLLNISTSTISDHIVKATKTIRRHFELNHIELGILLAAYLTTDNSGTLELTRHFLQKIA